MNKKVLGILILILIIIVALIARRFLPQRILPLVPEKKLTLRESKLVEGDTEQGVARRQQDGNVWRVFVSVKLPAPGASEQYHGWMITPDGLTRRYAGQFFPVQDGEYSLTYTTEEDVSKFATFQVSIEQTEMPSEPANIKLQWEFQ